jgi:hypothetical protein
MMSQDWRGNREKKSKKITIQMFQTQIDNHDMTH